MTHPRPVCSPNNLKRACSFDVDCGQPAAKKQPNEQSKSLARANDGVNTARNEPEHTREPHEHDILCGRGGFVNSHPGNVIFRSVVKANKERYRTCTVDHKALLSKSIVLAMRSQSPPGRFLTRSPGGHGWVEVGDAKALQKTSQALREGSAEGDLQIDIIAEPGPTGPSQEEMSTELLQQALLGLSNGQVTMNTPNVALSSQQTKSEITIPLGNEIVAADVLIGSDEITNSSEVDSAIIEESTSKSFRDLSSFTSGGIQLCELAAATLVECLVPGDEAFHRISDESLLSTYSDTGCLEALHFLYEDAHDVSFGLLPAFEMDMSDGEGDLLTDLLIAH